jgi:phage terminase small subunit
MLLQGAFDNMKTLREKEQSDFEKEAFTNYDRLKVLVEKGFNQARETNQYKETREFLKKIQSEFRGTRLTREQREELYSRLQTAFDILGKRLDEFFRQKKKNWAVKMQYKLSEYTTDIFDLEESLRKDRAYLKDLEDQLDIADSGGKGNIAITGLKSRIDSTTATIDRKEQQIKELESDMNELKFRLEQGE